jgi:hypothetical protein
MCTFVALGAYESMRDAGVETKAGVLEGWHIPLLARDSTPTHDANSEASRYSSAPRNDVTIRNGTTPNMD